METLFSVIQDMSKTAGAKHELLKSSTRIRSLDTNCPFSGQLAHITTIIILDKFINHADRSKACFLLY
jgi:hypothetical protein